MNKKLFSSHIIKTLVLLLLFQVIASFSNTVNAQSVVATIGVGNSPRGIEANATTNIVYVSNNESNNGSVIDGSTNQVIATIPVEIEPVGVGINSISNRIYFASVFGISVIDGTNNQLISTVQVGNGPVGVGVNSTTNRIYVANSGSNNVSVIDGISNQVIDTVVGGAYDIAVNPTTNHIFVTDPGNNNVSVINGSTNQVIATVLVDRVPLGVGINPSTNIIYVSNFDSNNVSVIDGFTNQVISTITVGNNPVGVAVNPITNKIFVANSRSNNISIIDGITNQVVNSIQVGNSPEYIAINSMTNRIYVANRTDNNVSVIQDLPVPSVTSTPTPSPTASPTPSPITTLTPTPPPKPIVVTLATGLSNPADIVVDNTSVYWIEAGSGSVKKISKNGGSKTTLASGLISVSGIAVDINNVYFTENVGIGVANIKKILKNGSKVTTIASDQTSTGFLTVDSKSVYWTDIHGGTIRKVPINGGSVLTLANGLNDPFGITIDSTSIYWTEFTNPGRVMKVGLNGGQVITLANNSNTPGITTNGNNVYWIEAVSLNNGKVNKVSVNGGNVTNLAAGLGRPWDIAIDADNVYWVENFQGGALKQIPLKGGSIITLANFLAEPVAIAIDSTHIYWVERNGGSGGAGTLKRVEKLTTSTPPDIIPPTVIITSPSDGNTVSGVRTVSTTASDDKGINKVEFYLDGGLKQTDTSSPYSWTWDTAKSSDGRHTIEVIAYDTANNQSLLDEIAVIVRNVSITNISIIPTTVDFGNVTNDKPFEKNITITNEFTSTDTLSGSVGSVSSPFFIITGGGSFSLLPGQSKEIVIRFLPTTSESFSDILSITHDATNQGSPITVQLSGTEQIVSLDINISINPTIVDFGNIPVGQSSDKAITITNETTSTGTLKVKVGSPSSPFSIANGESSFSITPRQHKQVVVRFSPTISESFSDNLLFTHNATNQDSPNNIPLIGTGEKDGDVISSRVPTAITYGLPIGGDIRGDLSKLTIETWSNNYPKIRFNDNGDNVVESNEWYVATAFNKNQWLNGGWNSSSLGDYSDFNNDGFPDYHPGEDWNLASGGATDSGKAIYAIANGVVVLSEEYYGNTLILAHRTISGEYITSFYGHMQNPSSFKAGDYISQGAQIGNIGDTGAQGNYHLHFEIRKDSMINITNGVIDKPGYIWPASDKLQNSDNGQGFIQQNYYDPSNFLKNYTYAPISGDWNGNNIGSVSKFKNNVFIINDQLISFGIPGDIPIAGDWDGDGFDDIGLFRPKENESNQSTFYLDTNNNGVSADRTVSFGFSPQNIPIAGDWDGDGYDDIGGFDPTTNTFYFYILNNTSIATFYKSLRLGIVGDYPIAGDWDGDGFDDVGVFRVESSTNQFYFDIGLTGGEAEYSQNDFGLNGFGNIGDIPIIGDWDGDGDDNIGVYRPSTDQFSTDRNVPDIEPPAQPIADFTTNPDSETARRGKVPLNVQFIDKSQPSEGAQIISWEWDFGDNTAKIANDPIPSHTYNLDGQYTVRLDVTDSNGLSDPDGEIKENYITVEATNIIPSINFFSINNGETATSDRTVTLNNSCSGNPTHYMASEDSNLSGANWQPYSTETEFTLSSSDGEKTVFFKVKNSTGESFVERDTITLDESLQLSITPPSCIQKSNCVFQFKGTGFTPLKHVTRKLQKPNGDIIILTPNEKFDGNADVEGEISWQFEPECGTDVGEHQVWVIDDTLGEETNKVSEIVEANIEVCGGDLIPPVAKFTMYFNAKTAVENETLKLPVPCMDKDDEDRNWIYILFSAINSIDIDGEITSYEWKDLNSTNILSQNMEFWATVGIGTTDILLTVTDNDGLQHNAIGTVIVTLTEIELDQQQEQNRPIVLGVSGGNAKNHTRFFAECSVGTLGSLVKSGNNLFILSNNHVMARTNNADIREDIIQPSLGELSNCLHSGPIDRFIDSPVADLTAFVTIDFNGGLNIVDAAIAKIREGKVDPDGFILEIGIPSSIPIEPFLGMKVKKSGRTTGVTHGIVIGIDATCKIDDGISYDNKQIAFFTNQICIEGIDGKPFSCGGDSGSLIVSDNEELNPIGLLFAGARGSTKTIANRIDQVLEQIGEELTDTLEIVGHKIDFSTSSEEPLEDKKVSLIKEPIPSKIDVKKAMKLHKKHNSNILNVTGVVGTCVGFNRKTGQVAIEVYVEEKTKKIEQLIPKELENIPVKIVVTGKIFFQ